MELNKLNKEQQAAVRQIGNPLLVLAGAGSGKTRVITNKIIYLIKNCNLSAKSIVAVTFTNKAASEMRQRVSKVLERQERRGLKVSTFHTLGLNIIKSELKQFNLRANFSILDEKDCLQMMQDIIESCDINLNMQYSLSDIKHKISIWKNELITPKQALLTATDEFLEQTAKVYQYYNKYLRSYNAVDFDDLLLLPLELFKSNNDILYKWQSKINYLLVDEYQDTNYIQYELIKLLLGSRNCLTVVGDDDQSVYAWRGARPENLGQLKEDYPNLEVVKLEQNYRSTSNILSAANELIANNPHIFTKKLRSNFGEGEKLIIYPCKDEAAEAEKIITDLFGHHFRTGAKWRDYAVIYRSNYQSRVFEQALRVHKIPYKMSGGQSFFMKSEIKDILSYLKLLVNPDDDSAFIRVFNIPRRDIGPKTMDGLNTYSKKREQSLFSSSFEIGLKTCISERGYSNLQKFSNFLVMFQERLKKEDINKVINDYINFIDYEEWIKETAATPKAGEVKVANVFELLKMIKGFSNKEDQDDSNSGFMSNTPDNPNYDGEKKLANILNKMMLIDMLDNQEDDEFDAVNLTTIHASKGLEYPNVYIVGMEEEILPHKVSLAEGNIEEERRLAYVAITRAQRRLVFSYSKKRKRQGEQIEVTVSRFLDEIPAQYFVEKQNTNVENKQEGMAHIAKLKDLLAK